MAIKMIRKAPDTGKLAEALQERSRLVSEVLDIQASLGDRNRRGPGGRRLTAQEYWEWRNRAMAALSIKQKRLTELKETIRQYRETVTSAVAGLTDTSDEGLLRAVYELLRNLVEDDVEFDAKELALIETVRNRVQHGRFGVKDTSREGGVVE